MAMIQAVEEARQQFENARKTLLENFAKIPDDKVAWSPAPTARTPIEIVAHCAEALGHLTGMMRSNPFEVPSTAEADRQFRQNEEAFTSRDQARDAFEQRAQDFIGLLEGLSEEDLDHMSTLPFGMGQAPMRVMITLPAMHTRSHVPQLEYLQTCYGDRTWLG
jgi:hypothetical protein